MRDIGVDYRSIQRILLADGWHVVDDGVLTGNLSIGEGNKERYFARTASQEGALWTSHGIGMACPLSSIIAVEFQEES